MVAGVDFNTVCLVSAVYVVWCWLEHCVSSECCVWWLVLTSAPCV